MKNIIELLYNKVKSGKMALEQVPIPYQEEVKALLDKEV